jgi:RNA polymerase sigma-70 factor (ECF subfamily)
MPNAKKLFEALVREHADMLTTFLKSAMGDSSDVDDLFQETMVIAWRRLDEFDQTRSFGPWLRGIAKNLVLAHHRKQSRWLCTPAALDKIDTRVAQIWACPGDTWREKLELVHDCVDSLPEHYRQTLSLRYFQQQAIGQVSTTMELSAAAVAELMQHDYEVKVQSGLQRRGQAIDELVGIQRRGNKGLPDTIRLWSGAESRIIHGAQFVWGNEEEKSPANETKRRNHRQTLLYLSWLMRRSCLRIGTTTKRTTERNRQLGRFLRICTRYKSSSRTML